MKHHLFYRLLQLFRKDILYTIINIVGLAIGLTCAFFILMYVHRELTFNHCHSNKDFVYRVNSAYEDFGFSSITPFPLGPSIKQDYPEVDAISRVRGSRVKIKKDQEEISAIVQGVDPGITDIFSFELIGSNRGKIIQQPDDIAISSSLAETLFGKKEAVGQQIECVIDDTTAVFTVSAIYRDFPKNSTFRPEAIFDVKWTLPRLKKIFRDPDLETNFRHNMFQNYIRLKPNSDPEDFDIKLQQVAKKYYYPPEDHHLQLQSLKDLYLHSSYLAANTTASGKLTSILTMGLLGILILLIGIFNFIILGIARSSTRFKEVGIMKTIGIPRSRLITKYLSEAVLIAICALPLAFIAMALFLPAVNNLFDAQLELPWKQQWQVIFFFIGICLLVGLISGSYLAIHLSRLNPVDILRNRLSLSGKKSIFYKALIILQIFIFITLMSSSAVISRQIKHMTSLDMGFEPNNLVIVFTNPFQMEQSKIFLEEIKKNSIIQNASISLTCSPSVGLTGAEVPHMQNPDQIVLINSTFAVGYDFVETFGLQVVLGRSFSRDFPSDITESIMITESVIEALGIQGNPIGQIVLDASIIGVVKDFHLQSGLDEILPVIIRMTNRFVLELPVRIADGRMQEGISLLQKIWEELNPDEPFEYELFTDSLSNLYSDEQNFGKIVKWFSVLSIIVAVLGLFGLSLFMASRRIHEIGIRKVHGASTQSIVLLLNRNFIWLITIAWLLSIPFTEFIMGKWLSLFVAKTNISTWIFAKSWLICLVVVLLVVSIRALKVARANPADSIRQE